MFWKLNSFLQILRLALFELVILIIKLYKSYFLKSRNVFFKRFLVSRYYRMSTFCFFLIFFGHEISLNIEIYISCIVPFVISLWQKKMCILFQLVFKYSLPACRGRCQGVNIILHVVIFIFTSIFCILPDYLKQANFFYYIPAFVIAFQSIVIRFFFIIIHRNRNF